MSQKYKSPEVLISELGITEPEEIDIDAIAEYCNAHIEYLPLNGCDGRIIGNGTRSIITISTSIPPSRRRFTAAHELGHWMCDRGESSILFADNECTIEQGWATKSRELRANEYAAKLLMPTTIFGARCNRKKPTLGLLDSLARDFSTSLSSTCRRYVECSTERCAVVFSTDGRIHSMTRSKDFGYWIPVGEPLDKYTLAVDYSKNMNMSDRAESVDASAWLEGNFREDSMIREESRSLPKYGMVVSLLWIKNDIEKDDGDWDDREHFTEDGKY